MYKIYRFCVLKLYIDYVFVLKLYIDYVFLKVFIFKKRNVDSWSSTSYLFYTLVYKLMRLHEMIILNSKIFSSIILSSVR